MNTILQFAFETGDTDPPYYQVIVIVKSDDAIDYETIEDFISSYMERSDDDAEYEHYVEDIMNGAGLSWSFASNILPESKEIHTFWI